MDTFCPKTENICLKHRKTKQKLAIINSQRLHPAVILSLKSDFDAKSEIHSQTPEYVKLNVLNEDKRESRH